MLLLFVALNFVAAGLGARVGERGDGTEVWFASLAKPEGFPADWTIARLWTLVGIATGIGGWWLWRAWAYAGVLPGRELGYAPLVLYGFYLVFSAAWQGVSIGLRNLGRGFGFALLCWITLTLTMILAAEARGWGWLWLAPAWLWVGYGTRLNYLVWQGNRALS